MLGELEEDILRALRRITRAIDLHSRHLATTFGLTGPQLVCLRTIGQRPGGTTPSELAKAVALSQATITGIIDRLAARQLVCRERIANDRRVVTVRITSAGQALIEQAPSPLQERFAQRLAALEREEQQNIRDSLRRIVSMMDGAEEIDAAPVLSSSSMPMPVEELAETDDAVEANVAGTLLESAPGDELTAGVAAGATADELAAIAAVTRRPEPIGAGAAVGAATRAAGRRSAGQPRARQRRA